MPTELTPTSRSLSMAIEDDGRPTGNGLYTPTTTQAYHYGKRLITWDGKVFKYSKSNAVWRTGTLAMFGNVAGTSPSIDYAAVYQAQAIGDTSLIMTNVGTAITEDALVGGHITINYSPPDANNMYLQQRTVVGNSSAAATSGLCTIYLDAALDRALTTASYAFVMPSPWSSVGYVASPTRSAAGIPAAYVSATGYFGWVQTWGQCWITDIGSTLGKTDHYRQVVLNESCGVGPHLYSTASLGTQQHIGFIMDNNGTANGATVLFLQITPV